MFRSVQLARELAAVLIPPMDVVHVAIRYRFEDARECEVEFSKQLEGDRCENRPPQLSPTEFQRSDKVTTCY